MFSTLLYSLLYLLIPLPTFLSPSLSSPPSPATPHLVSAGGSSEFRAYPTRAPVKGILGTPEAPSEAWAGGLGALLSGELSGLLVWMWASGGLGHWHRLFCIAVALASAHVLSEGTTFTWDTCGYHALLLAWGGRAGGQSGSAVWGKTREPR